MILELSVGKDHTAVVGGPPASVPWGEAEPLLITPLDPGVLGPNVTLVMVRWRHGRKHQVRLHIEWLELLGEWALRRYDERPISD